MTSRREILSLALTTGVGLSIAAAVPRVTFAADRSSKSNGGHGSRADQTTDDRAHAILAEMTIDEKLAMLSGTSGIAVLQRDPAEKRIGAGHVPGIPRLGVPDLWETDASLGVAYAGDLRKGDVATALPSSLATAATFDPELAYAGSAMIGAEARAKGFNVLLAGGANLIRDPWGGRAFEYLSEDPLLTGIMAGESIRGVQSNRIVSTIKHFALNPQESGRYVVDARISQEALQESDLLAFEIAIERGRPGSVMSSYNKVNGDWTSENAYLLTTVLRGDWNYDGWVMSDWGSVHSAEKAANAGLDQQSGREFDKEPYFAGPLKAAVEAKRVSEAAIDEKVMRILRQMLRVGLVDDPAPASPQAIDYRAHADIAQRVAEAGIVLLRNTDDTLPLSPDVHSIAIIGGHADIGVLSGGGSSQVCSVGGFAVQIPQEGVGPFAGLMTRSYHNSSPLAAIRARCPSATVEFSPGTDPRAAATLAKRCQVSVIFVEDWRTEVLDQPSLNLTREQEALIEAVAAANPYTVVVLQSGGPVVMPWASKVKSILAVWYPGQRGGDAIARVLFGEIDASGRLPVTFPASADQAPRPRPPGYDEARIAFKRLAEASLAEIGSIGLAGGQESFPADYHEGADAGYRWYALNGFQPAYPFGFGLSYTSFLYRNLRVRNGHGSTANVTITNTGKRRGTDIAQVYAYLGNVPRLVGFKRVELDIGETRQVTVDLDARPVQTFDMKSRSRRPITKPLRIGVGRSSAEMKLFGRWLP